MWMNAVPPPGVAAVQEGRVPVLPLTLNPFMPLSVRSGGCRCASTRNTDCVTRPSPGPPPHRLAPFDVVRITAGLPQHGIAPGTRAVILEIHEDPYLAYEIEVVGDDGHSLFIGAVDPAQVERVWSDERAE